MLKTTGQELDSVVKKPVIAQRPTPMEKGRVTHTHIAYLLTLYKLLIQS